MVVIAVVDVISTRTNRNYIFGSITFPRRTYQLCYTLLSRWWNSCKWLSNTITQNNTSKISV